MVRKKQKAGKEPEIVEAEPLKVVLPQNMSVAEFLRRRMLRNREPKNPKVEMDAPDAETRSHSPVKEPASKKDGKKAKTTKKRVPLLDEKKQEEEKPIFQVQTRAAQREQVERDRVSRTDKKMAWTTKRKRGRGRISSEVDNTVAEEEEKEAEKKRTKSDKSYSKGRSRRRRKATRQQKIEKRSVIEEVTEQAQEKESEQNVEDEETQKQVQENQAEQVLDDEKMPKEVQETEGERKEEVAEMPTQENKGKQEVEDAKMHKHVQDEKVVKSKKKDKRSKKKRSNKVPVPLTDVAEEGIHAEEVEKVRKDEKRTAAEKLAEQDVLGAATKIPRTKGQSEKVGIEESDGGSDVREEKKDTQVALELGEYFIPPDSWFYCKTNLYGRGLEVIDTILEQIGQSKRMVGEFRAYAVGHLLDLDSKSLGWAPSLVHHLLLRQISNNDASGVWFKEGEECFRFGVDEFCLLTGLKGIKDMDLGIPQNDDLIDTYFPKMADDNKKRKGIRRGELRDAFISCTRRSDKVKLGVAYLVECLLLGNIEKKLINLDTLRLVTDVDSFKNVAWGSKGFHCLLPYLIDFRELSPEKQAFQLGGFYLVLQLFALEVFPTLREFCATRDRAKWPRILGWQMRKGPYKLGYSVLSSLVFNEQVEVSPMKPLKHERSQSALHGLFAAIPDEKEDAETSVDERTRDKEEEERKPRQSRPKEDIKLSDVRVQPVKQLLSEFKLFREKVQLSFAALSAENSDIKSQLSEATKLIRLFTTTDGKFKGIFCPSCRAKEELDPTHSEEEGPELSDTMFGKSAAGHGEGIEEEEFPDIESYSQTKCVAPSPVTLLVSQQLNKHERGECDDGPEGVRAEKSDDVPEEDGNIPEKKDSAVVAEEESFSVSMGDSEPIELTKSEYQRKHATKRPLKPNPHVSGGPWTPEGKRRKANNVFSDLKAPVNEQRLAEFISWYEQGLQKSNKLEPFPGGGDLNEDERCELGNLVVTKKNFFHRINQPNAWLTDEEINVIWYYIREKQHFYPSLTMRRSTTADSYFQNYFCCQWDRYRALKSKGLRWDVDSQIQRYVVGAAPRLARPWHEVDNVFFPINVRNYHWCLGVLDLPNWNLVIFDNLRRSIHDRKVLHAVNPLATMIYDVLDSCGYFSQTPELADKKDLKMSVCRVTSPTQSGGGDCGMFCCKFLEFMICNRSHKEVLQQDMDYYRKKYAVELFFYGRRKTAV